MPMGSMNDDHALVLFSGGQDSATCLAWALARYPLVETVGFAYGQRHAVELDCRGPVSAAIDAMSAARASHRAAVADDLVDADPNLALARANRLPIQGDL